MLRDFLCARLPTAWLAGAAAARRQIHLSPSLKLDVPLYVPPYQTFPAPVPDSQIMTRPLLDRWKVLPVPSGAAKLKPGSRNAVGKMTASPGGSPGAGGIFGNGGRGATVGSVVDAISMARSLARSGCETGARPCRSTCASTRLMPNMTRASVSQRRCCGFMGMGGGPTVHDPIRPRRLGCKVKRETEAIPCASCWLPQDPLVGRRNLHSPAT